MAALSEDKKNALQLSAYHSLAYPGRCVPLGSLHLLVRMVSVGGTLNASPFLVQFWFAGVILHSHSGMSLYIVALPSRFWTQHDTTVTFRTNRLTVRDGSLRRTVRFDLNFYYPGQHLNFSFLNAWRSRNVSK